MYNVIITLDAHGKLMSVYIILTLAESVLQNLATERLRRKHFVSLLYHKEVEEKQV